MHEGLWCGLVGSFTVVIMSCVYYTHYGFEEMEMEK